MTEENKACIEIRNVDFTYCTSREPCHALGGVSFDVYKKEFVSIIGPSGCGKSTLLRVIGGLLNVTKGKILVDGETPSTARKKAKFGFVFQFPVLLPWRDSTDNVLLPIEILRRQKERNKKKAKELLSLVGLNGFERRLPGELSGGMQQRVAISRALVFDPAILLMDEPFGALDAITRDKLNMDLLRIWDQTHKTIIFVTHSISEAVFLSNRVVVLSQRPGIVMKTVDVDLPFPRSMEIKDSPKFIELVAKLRRMLGLSPIHPIDAQKH